MTFSLVMFMERAEWTELAACKGEDPAVFYPGGFAVNKGRREVSRGVQRGIDAAKAICRRCDVQAECLAFAMNNDERDGIWGGLTVAERDALRGPRTPTPPQINHGTNGGHMAHLRRGEQPCRDCLHAHSMYQHYSRPSRAGVSA